MVQRVMQWSFGAGRPAWYRACAMGQARFLSAVHDRVRSSARAGTILDAYHLADELMAQNGALVISRDVAVRTVLAASVVYGAPLLLDPRRRINGAGSCAGK